LAARRRERDLQLLRNHIGPIAPNARPPPRPPPIGTSQQPVLILDVRRLQLLGAFKAGSFGRLVWPLGEGRRATALYSHTEGTLTIHEVERDNAYATSETNIEVVHLAVFSGGGMRPWLVCRMPNESQPCGRRALKLYLPAGETIFRCRTCLGRRRLGPLLARLSEATTHTLRGFVALLTALPLV
jgi:hypothetical protein